MDTDGLQNAFDIISKIIAITIIMLIILEGAAFFVEDIYIKMRPAPSSYAKNEVYANQSWVGPYWEQLSDADAKREYYPYLEYRMSPNYRSDYINSDEEGLRRTWNSPLPSDSNAIRIFCFGGSTMWGWGVRDEYTIPSYLSKKLHDKGYSVRVTNFGQSGYVNTQELIQLLLELRKGNVPDVVVFYDGVNDVTGTYRNQIAGSPADFVEQRKRQYDFDINKFNIIDFYYEKSYVVKGIRYASKLILGQDIGESRISYINETRHYDDRQLLNLSNDTVNMYLNDIEMIKALELKYGFKSYFFLQPVVYSKSARSSTESRIIDALNEYHPGIDKLTVSTYSLIRSRINSSNSMNVHYIADIFDEMNKTVFIDWCHLSEEGNEIVAEKMSDKIRPFLDR